MTQVTPTELLSQDNSIGLPLGSEAPVMTPNGVLFLFFSSDEVASCDNKTGCRCIMLTIVASLVAMVICVCLVHRITSHATRLAGQQAPACVTCRRL